MHEINDEYITLMANVSIIVIDVLYIEYDVHMVIINYLDFI